MEPSTLVPVVISLAGFLIAVLTFIASQVSGTRMAGKNYVESLERRLVCCETETKECIRDRERLTRENVEIMRRLAQMENGGK